MQGKERNALKKCREKERKREKIGMQGKGKGKERNAGNGKGEQYRERERRAMYGNGEGKERNACKRKGEECREREINKQREEERQRKYYFRHSL